MAAPWSCAVTPSWGPSKSSWSSNSSSICRRNHHHASPRQQRRFPSHPTPCSGDFRDASVDIAHFFTPVEKVGLVCINTIHITPWEACKGLMTGAERILRSGGVLYLYGPYQIDGRHTAQSNEEFDAWLRTQNAQWGVRDLAEVTDLAQRRGFSLAETIPMPANNLSVIFERGP